MADRKLRVFLCHASQDKPIVHELYQKLLAEGWIDPWLDEEKLLPGQDWDMEIEKAVEAADAVIVCLSNNLVTKEGYVQRELRFVINIADEKPEGTIFIIPLRFDNVQPPRLIRSWQYVDFFPSTHREQAYQRLLESLRNRFEQQQQLQELLVLVFDINEYIQKYTDDPDIQALLTQSTLEVLQQLRALLVVDRVTNSKTYLLFLKALRDFLLSEDTEFEPQKKAERFEQKVREILLDNNLPDMPTIGKIT